MKTKLPDIAHTRGVVWFSGRPGAGKSTTGRAVQHHLVGAGLRVPLLDGDVTRRAVDPWSALASTPRPEVAALHARLAHMLADQGLLVLVAAVSGMEHLREMAAASMIPTVEVFIDVAAPAARARRLAQDASCETERGSAEETYVPPRNPTIVRNETFDPGRPVDVADLVTEIFAQLVATHPTAPAVN